MAKSFENVNGELFYPNKKSLDNYHSSSYNFIHEDSERHTPLEDSYSRDRTDWRRTNDYTRS